MNIIQTAKKILNKARLLVPSAKNVSLTDAKGFIQTYQDWISIFRKNDTYFGVIAACIEVWGRHLAKAEFELFDSDEENIKINSHPVLSLLKNPNPFFSAWEMKFRLAQDFTLFGNSYMLKIRNRLGTPVMLIQLHPERVFTYPYDMEYIEHYEYRTGKEILKFTPADVLHFRMPDPYNYIKGRPIINNILDQAAIAKFQVAYIAQFYKQGGFLGQTFTTEQQMNAPSFERTKKELRDMYGNGVENAFKVAFFDSGLKPVNSTYSMKEMDISNQRVINKQEILNAFGVNKFLLGESELVQRGNAETVIYQFTSGVIEPLLCYIDEILNRDLIQTDFKSLRGEPAAIYIEHESQVPRDTDTDLRYWESGLDYGWLAPDEVRTSEGYSALGGEYSKPRLNKMPSLKPAASQNENNK